MVNRTADIVFWLQTLRVVADHVVIENMNSKVAGQQWVSDNRRAGSRSEDGPAAGPKRFSKTASQCNMSKSVSNVIDSGTTSATLVSSGDRMPRIWPSDTYGASFDSMIPRSSGQKGWPSKKWDFDHMLSNGVPGSPR